MEPPAKKQKKGKGKGKGKGKEKESEVSSPQSENFLPVESIDYATLVFPLDRAPFIPPTSKPKFQTDARISESIPQSCAPPFFRFCEATMTYPTSLIKKFETTLQIEQIPTCVPVPIDLMDFDDIADRCKKWKPPSENLIKKQDVKTAQLREAYVIGQWYSFPS